MLNRRKHFASGLSQLYLPSYEVLCDLLPTHWQPYSGFRSTSYQDSLYAKGRTSPGKKVTNARGGASAHNYGCASDWTVFDGEQAIWLKASDPLWKEYEDACAKAGLKWGGHYASLKDCFHNELELSEGWSAVKAVADLDGMQAALAFIEKIRVK
jgi:hypothetical protein